MVLLLNWNVDEVMMYGNCIGHEKLADGMHIHTSPYVKIEVCEEGLSVVTFSGTHYLCRVKDINLNALEQTKEALAASGVDISFLDNVSEVVEKAKKEKAEEVSKLIGDNDLYLEFAGIAVVNAFFKSEGVLIPLEPFCHVGTFQDSYLIRKAGIVDVRYFDKVAGVDFYHVSDGINNIYFRHVGDSQFCVTGIGDGFTIKKGDTEVKIVKP